MPVNSLDGHIEATPGLVRGKPRIAGRRITVQNIAICHERLGMVPDEIADQFDITLADVFAALTYYFDHRQEIDEVIRRDHSFAEALRSQSPSKLWKKLADLT